MEEKSNECILVLDNCSKYFMRTKQFAQSWKAGEMKRKQTFDRDWRQLVYDGEKLLRTMERVELREDYIQSAVFWRDYGRLHAIIRHLRALELQAVYDIVHQLIR